MKPSKLLAIFVVLLVGIGTCLVLRQRCLAGFRAESRRLREHTREVEWLRAENESLQRQATSAKTAKITTEEISELMRLRSEAGRLRVELGEELRKSASTNDQLIADLSATEDARKPDEWSDLGAATPTAALQTVFWAWNTTNLDRAAELFQLDIQGPASPALEAIMRGAMEPHVRSTLFMLATNTLSLEIISQQPINDHEINLNFWKTTRDGNKVRISQKMRRVENQWDFVCQMEPISESPPSFRFSLPFMPDRSQSPPQ
jgi:hypothetical protein